MYQTPSSPKGAVLAEMRAGLGAHLGALFAGRAEADERPREGAQLGQLMLVLDLDLLDAAVLVLVDEQQVDDAHDVVVGQPLSSSSA